MNRHHRTILKSDRGATLVLVAICLTALVGFATLAIDIGYLYAARNELQNVADAAALAAARKLGNIYQGMSSPAEQGSYVCDKTEIVQVVQDVARQNQVVGERITILPEDVLIGHWGGSGAVWGARPGVTYWVPDGPYPENLSQPDAVHVTVRRDGQGSEGPVTTFFARVLGIDTVNVSATATAALTPMSNNFEMILPVGISKYWFTNNSCNDAIRFSPANDPLSCAGWHSFTYNSNDSNLRKILNEDPNYQSPETNADETIFNFTGGSLSNPTFDATLSLFQRKGHDQDAAGNDIIGADGEPLHDATGHPDAVPLYDSAGVRLTYPDGTPRNKHHWSTSVVVYDRDDCSNPNQSIKIVGFAQIDITEILSAPDKIIEGKVLCNYVSPDDVRSGGAPFGAMGSIPGLVE